MRRMNKTLGFGFMVKRPKKLKKLRPLGNITSELEPLLQELTCGNDKYKGQDLQAGEVLSLVLGYLEIHVPGCIEAYTDGTRPILYGHKEAVKQQTKEKSK